MSGHSGAAAPRSQPLCPGADSLSLPLITHMPVSHLSAAPTDLRAVGFQQLSGFVSASLKAPAAAGELTLISGAVVSCLVPMPHVCDCERTEEDSCRLDSAAMLACTKSLSFCVVAAHSLSTKALLQVSEKPQLAHPCHLTFHYPRPSRQFKARNGRIFSLFMLP